MTTEQQYRQLAAEIGIEDDRAESMFLDLMKSKDADLELERGKVPDQVWRLEDELMEMRCKYESA